MILKVIENISKNIKAHYPEYDILINYLEQGFEKVMYLEIMSVKEKKRIFKKKDYIINFQINIYNKHNNDDIMSVGYDLYSILEYITIENVTLKLSKPKFDIFNDIGRFLGTYTITVDYDSEDKVRMNDLYLGVRKK